MSEAIIKVDNLVKSFGVEPLAHLTCINSDRAAVSASLQELAESGIDNVLALLPSRLPAVSFLGGKVEKNNRFTHSPQAMETLSQLRFNTAFIGMAKIGPDGAYLKDADDAAMIQLAISRAQRVVLVAEKHKFVSEITAPYQSAPLDRIDVVITDAPLDAETQKLFSPKTRLIYL